MADSVPGCASSISDAMQRLSPGPYSFYAWTDACPLAHLFTTKLPFRSHVCLWQKQAAAFLVVAHSDAVILNDKLSLFFIQGNRDTTFDVCSQQRGVLDRLIAQLFTKGDDFNATEPTRQEGLETV